MWGAEVSAWGGGARGGGCHGGESRCARFPRRWLPNPVIPSGAGRSPREVEGSPRPTRSAWAACLSAAGPFLGGGAWQLGCQGFGGGMVWVGGRHGEESRWARFPGRLSKAEGALRGVGRRGFGVGRRCSWGRISRWGISLRSLPRAVAPQPCHPERSGAKPPRSRGISPANPVTLGHLSLRRRSVPRGAPGSLGVKDSAVGWCGWVGGRHGEESRWARFPGWWGGGGRHPGRGLRALALGVGPRVRGEAGEGGIGGPGGVSAVRTRSPAGGRGSVALLVLGGAAAWANALPAAPAFAAGVSRSRSGCRPRVR